MTNKTDKYTGRRNMQTQTVRYANTQKPRQTNRIGIHSDKPKSRHRQTERQWYSNRDRPILKKKKKKWNTKI